MVSSVMAQLMSLPYLLALRAMRSICATQGRRPCTRRGCCPPGAPRRPDTLVVSGVHPLVDPVELVRYAVLGKAGSQLLRPAAAVGHGPAAHVLQHVPALRRYAPLLPHVQRPFGGASFKKGALRPGCGSQRLLRCRLHPAGRCPYQGSSVLARRQPTGTVRGFLSAR